MKRIIEVELKTRTTGLAECQTQMLVIGHFSDAKKPLPEIIELCKKLSGAIEQVVKLGDFKGKEGTSSIIYSNGQIGAERVLMVGLGEPQESGGACCQQGSRDEGPENGDCTAQDLWCEARFRAYGAGDCRRGV